MDETYFCARAIRADKGPLIQIYVLRPRLIEPISPELSDSELQGTG